MKLNFSPRYQQLLDTLGAYTLACSTVYVDQYTVAPKKGASRTNEALTILSQFAFNLENNPSTIAWLEEEYAAMADGSLEQKEVGLRLKKLQDTREIPSPLYRKWQESAAESETIWHEAKVQSDYERFCPALEKVISYTLQAASYSPRFDPAHPYDYLLSLYEPGMNQEKYDAFFEAILEDLGPLVKKAAAARPKDLSLLHAPVSDAQQEKLASEVLDFLKADWDRLAISTTEHPFTDFLSHDDVRITTHYEPDQFVSSILSTVHEYGHALYHLQTEAAFDKTMLVEGVGCAAHESQSRLLENHIGRSRAFWSVLLPALRKEIPALETVDADTLFTLVNTCRPSLIRTDADELTYPFHILIRYEIEKKMAAGTLDYATLPQLWNDLYETYLGARPENDREGVLQDVHWSSGDLGYFPSYALGSAYAAQIYEAMERDIDPEQLILENRFEDIAAWLEKNVHRYGASKTMLEIVEEVSGKPFDPHIYTGMLKKKYAPLLEDQAED